jgi:hypothetical protein
MLTKVRGSTLTLEAFELLYQISELVRTKPWQRCQHFHDCGDKRTFKTGAGRFEIGVDLRSLQWGIEIVRLASRDRTF